MSKLPNQQGAKAMTTSDGEIETVITFKGTDYPISVKYASNQDALHNMLRYNAETHFAADAIAYTGDNTIYLIDDASSETRAHEATHMALTILAKSGVTSLSVTSDDADKSEEDLCSLIGCIADWLIQAREQSAYEQGRGEGRNKLLNKLLSTYRLIQKPIKDSPMELTEEAKQYNHFVEDLHKFISAELERKQP